MALSAPSSLPADFLAALERVEELSQKSPKASSRDAQTSDSARLAAQSMRITELLAAEGFSAESRAWALSQRELRSRAGGKFPPRLQRSLLYTRAGLEQASRDLLARYHAQMLVEAGVKKVIDAGCGLGADSLAFLEAGLDVLAIEIDPETASLTAWNLSVPRVPVPGVPVPSARVVVGDVLELIDEGFFDEEPWREYALWFDPARRDAGPGGNRRFDPEAFSPPLSTLTALAQAQPRRILAAKLGPALEATDIPAGFDLRWITQGSDTSEAVILHPSSSPALEAVYIDDAGRECSRRRARTDPTEGDLGVAENVFPGDLVWEPVGSVLRAGLVQDLGKELGAQLLAPQIAYVLTSQTEAARLWPDSTPRHPMATGYRVLEVLPLHQKKLKAWAKALGVTELTIKKRGVDIDPATLRKQLLAGSRPGKGPRRPATLILTRHGQERVAIAVEVA